MLSDGGGLQEWREQVLPGERPLFCDSVAGASRVNVLLIRVPLTLRVFLLVGALLCLFGNAITGTVGGLQVQSQR